ncbi:hypothetical protein R3P38DRAFT_2815294 [Favolaschia claudopus]|uniref:Uncharacterized protein n=1 Tax=Favolaschia claudopus TaxID=2862362 RepID=A0AAV9Z1G4_9AGAR
MNRTALESAGVAYGRNQDPTPCHFPQWSKARFGQDVLGFMREWLKTAYTPAQCAESALPKAGEDDEDPLAQAKYRFDAVDDWGNEDDSDSDEGDDESDSSSSSDSDSDSDSTSDDGSDDDNGAVNVKEVKKKVAKKTVEVRKERSKASERAKGVKKAGTSKGKGLAAQSEVNQDSFLWFGQGQRKAIAGDILQLLQAAMSSRGPMVCAKFNCHAFGGESRQRDTSATSAVKLHQTLLAAVNEKSGGGKKGKGKEKVVADEGRKKTEKVPNKGGEGKGKKRGAEEETDEGAKKKSRTEAEGSERRPRAKPKMKTGAASGSGAQTSGDTGGEGSRTAGREKETDRPAQAPNGGGETERDRSEEGASGGKKTGGGDNAPQAKPPPPPECPAGAPDYYKEVYKEVTVDGLGEDLTLCSRR